MAAPISFLNKVVHEDRTLANGFFSGIFGIVPAAETTPCVLVESRGTGTGYDDLWVGSGGSGPTFYELVRGDNSGDLVCRVQVVDWNVGRQP